MSIKCHWIKDNQTTEFTVTLLKPLKDCTLTDFNKNAFAASYDQLNNVAYVGTVPQNATSNSTDTVWFNIGNSIDFSTLCFSAKNESQFYRRTLVIAVPQHTEISSFTQDTIPENVYLVSDIQSLNKVILVNSVQYRNDFLRTQLNFSKPLRHCLYDSVFNYDNAVELITDGDVNYQLIPVFMYVFNDQIFITCQDTYSVPTLNVDTPTCGFTDGIPCFTDSDIKLCLGINPNDRNSAVSLTAGYYNKITESVFGDMINIYDCSSTVNADIKLSIYSEQDSPERLYLQRGILLNTDCYTACASQYGFIFANNITNEIYEPAMRDGIVEGYKELVYKPVKFRLLSTNNSTNQLRTVPPIADVQISNEQEYYTVGTGVVGRWQVRKYSINDLEHPVLVEDFGAKNDILDAYLEADGDFDYFAGDEHVSLVTSGTPWIVVIRASDKHMYVKKVGADVSTAVLLDTDVEQASVCRGWKSDKYNVDAGLIVAYRKATGVFMRAYYKINDVYTWDTVQILSGIKATRVEVKRLNDFRIGIYSYSQNNQNQVWLSPRYYIGGTSKTEYLVPKVQKDFDVFSIMSIDGAHDDLQIVDVTLLNNIEFRVTANYPFYWRDTTWNDISITYGAAAFTIDSYRIEDGFLYIRMNQPYSSQYLHVEFTIRKLNRIRFKRSDQSIPICPEITIVYYKPAYAYSSESIGITTTADFALRMKQKQTYRNTLNERFTLNMTADFALSVAQLTKQYGYSDEHLSVAVSDLHCTLRTQQVGDVPV